ncbi:ATP-binding protein [Sinorhizobium medicae]|nr:ATP-binding protein [Sinorhizobium medicae]MDX0578837.1 ATP-binding protein [Sinorhizobium medicae]MDX0782676.1 ATP-binding protein [Sinorhizobium medicae]
MTTLYGLEDLAVGPGENVTKLRLFDGPLDLGWKHCAMTSDFVAEFAALRYKTSRVVYKEVRHNVGYLTNELIENAVKFCAGGEIVVEASIASNTFRTKVSNLVDKGTADTFRHILSEITIGDPSDLLIQRIEANATGSGSGSGLGLLTLMSDYGAHFAWVFGSGEEDGKIPLETYASIAIPDLSN